MINLSTFAPLDDSTVVSALATSDSNTAKLSKLDLPSSLESGFVSDDTVVVVAVPAGNNNVTIASSAMNIETKLADIDAISTETSNTETTSTTTTTTNDDDDLLVPCSDAPATIIERHMALVVKEEAPDDPFYVADIGEVIRQHDKWISTLPTVEPFYAVKCNPDPLILSALARLGIGFDCASKAEIAAVLDLENTNANTAPVDAATRIIYANPCKAASHIRYAASRGVRMMTFDNADELYKIKRYHDKDPQLVLRIVTDDSRSICRFGVKFGAHAAHVRPLLALAQSLDLNVIGISFHVGSGCCDANAYADAIRAARDAFDVAESLGISMSLLDIGGGFPGAEAHTGVSFSEIAAVVRPSLAAMFPATRVISEPGRYFVSSAYTLAVNVHARRIVPDASGDAAKTSFMYYINEGLYSSLNCIYYDHAHVKPRVLLKDGAMYLKDNNAHAHAQHHACSIWGPTCDSMDMITKSGMLPELNVGDWLYFEWMGAYTVAAATTFNGFAQCNVMWTNTERCRLRL